MQAENCRKSVDAVDQLDDLYKQTLQTKKKQLQIIDILRCNFEFRDYKHK